MDYFNNSSREPEQWSRSISSNLAIPDLVPQSFEENDDSVSAPRTRGRSRTFSQLATSIISPANEKLPSGSGRLASSISDDTLKHDRPRQETRKLVSHILNELQNRPRPPSVWDTFKSDYGAQSTGSHTKLAFKLGSSQPFRSGSLSLADSDSDEELNSAFSPDVTLDLLSQLKETLLLSRLKSLFEEDSGHGASHSETAEKPSSFRFRRSSFNTGGRRARSFSPGNPKKTSSGLLSQFIVILASVILEDCRFQISSVRLTRPPNVLQALTLDVSQIIIHMYRGNARVLYDIGLAVMPAFSTFPESMQRRLLIFFEDGLLRTMLHNLRGVQNSISTSLNPSSNQDIYDNQQDPPIVAIQVDEVPDDSFHPLNSSREWDQWVSSKTGFQGILSTNAPAQSMEIYYLASVTGPLLSAILDSVDLQTGDPVLRHRLQSFFSFLAECKPDAPLDLLQTVAYHSARARYAAISLLITYWPKSFGHLSVSKPFPVPTHYEAFQTINTMRMNQGHIVHPHFHQFVPWHFDPPSASAVFEGASLHDCHSCLKQISGFGLLCPFCMCTVHFSCYDSPDGSHLSHYSVAGERGTSKVAVHRFSHIRPRRLGYGPEVIRRDQHAFKLVNIFTLSLCGACRLPLWGHLAQGYRCGACNQYAHSSCLHGEEFHKMPLCHSELDSELVTIKWTELRASFINFYSDIIFREEDISRCTFEELSIFWSLLWMQLQFLKYGVASGSVIVTRDRNASNDTQPGADNFELQHLEKLYHAYLGSDRLHVAPMVQDLLQQNGYVRDFRYFLYDWPILLYITSVVKSPSSTETEDANNFLNVAMTSRDENMSADLSMHPAEIVSVAHVRDALGYNFGLRQTYAACAMLGHLRHLGFFDSTDLPEGLFRTCERPMDTMCSFSLPLGLDISPNVEILIVAVEACLEDLDISVNESGFLLLIRKLWPNGMASDYAIARLMRAVLLWILSEDDNLVIILREYVAKNKRLPGVPSISENQSWPNSVPSRSTSSGSVNNGNDYVSCRKSLLERYATRWLFALHCRDPEAYATLVFETVSELAMESSGFTDEAVVSDLTPKEKQTLSTCADKVLRSIMKISQSSIAFSVVDDLFLKWLTVFPSKLSPQKPLPTLPRLFNRESEGSARWTSAFDATITSFEHVNAPLLDPWRVVTGIASHDYDGLKRGLDWLSIFASSGVDIPVTTFLQISALARDLNATFEDHLKLAEAAFMAIWIKSLGRQDLQKMIADLHDRNANLILAQLGKEEDSTQIYRFFRLTLSSFLLLYGCERPRLLEVGLILASDVEGLSRRKTQKRASLVSDPLIEDLDLIEILMRYMEEGRDELRCLIARFLTCFVTESSLLSAQELETVILRNSYSLTRCTWKLYDMQTPSINDLRVILLLRVLVIDTRHFEELLLEVLSEEYHWDNRFSSVTKLFQIILDVAKPAFSVDGRQWRSSVMEIFFRFFSSMWSSDREEIRVATDAWSQTLQPAHQQSMTLCFSEYLTRAPISERVEFVSFLLQLRSHFPTWKVLAWDVVIETLMDDDFMQRNDADESAISAHLSMYGLSSHQDTEASVKKDPDMAILQSSLILLSLQMIAEGVPIDVFSYLKIKMQLVALIGFSGATLVPAPSGHSFHVHFGELKSLNPSSLPCIPGLMVLLDAYRLFDLAPSAMTANGADDDNPYPVIVGSVVADVFLGLFQYLLDNFNDFPYPYVKVMLQSLIIVIYKHDVESVPLRHLREVVRRIMKRVPDLLLADIGSESKQLILTAIQAYRKRWLNYASSRDLIVHQVSSVIKFVSVSTATKDDFLVGQGMLLLEDILTMHSGTFYNLSKQPLSQDTFAVIRLVMARNARNLGAQASLPDVVLRDTLQILISVQNDSERKYVLENLKTYIEVVHFQGYSSESLSHTGECFIVILRNASELSDETFDPNPLLLAAATLIQYNKAQVRGFLPHLETAVRIALARFDVTEKALRRLAQVTSTLYRRTAAEPVGSAHDRNTVLTVIIDVLSDGLRGKCRVTPLTLKAIVDSLFSTSNGYLTSGALSRLANDALFFLQSSNSMDMQPQNGLHASRAASLLIIRAEGVDKGLISRYLSENASERNGRHSITVRAWNALAIETLQSNMEGKPASQLFENISNFSPIYHVSLRAQTQAIGLPPDMTASDINQAFIAIKLWLLLARRCAEETLALGGDPIQPATGFMTEDRNASLVWNELWPPFERLVMLSEADAEVGDLTPIATLVWSSVADIFLFLRMMRSPISLESASHIATLNKVKNLGKGESFTGKFARTLKSIMEPPVEVPMASLIAQTTQELLAAEKLHALESRRELGRMLPDRGRRELRAPTG